MFFHEQLFKNKGWANDTGKSLVKVTVVSVIGGDKINDCHYCKSFYQGLVLILDKLNLKRSNKSYDLDEIICRIMQNNPENILSKQFSDKVQLSTKPFFFYGEKTALSDFNLKEFASYISNKHSISDYVIALFDKETKDTFFTVKSKGKKDTLFKLRQSANTLEEI